MSSRIARLLANYRQRVAAPWPQNLSGPERVFFVVYDPADERRLRLRLPEFELATREASHGWTAIDLTDAFPHWMAEHRYRDRYFANPALLQPALRQFEATVGDSIRAALSASSPSAVVAVSGVATLFGLVHVSDVLKGVHDDIPGRLVVFFPGDYADNVYHLLEARAGWNYMAVPITAHEGTALP